jgi:hypothetical protein
LRRIAREIAQMERHRDSARKRDSFGRTEREITLKGEVERIV